LNDPAFLLVSVVMSPKRLFLRHRGSRVNKQCPWIHVTPKILKPLATKTTAIGNNSLLFRLRSKLYLISDEPFFYYPIENVFIDRLFQRRGSA